MMQPGSGDCVMSLHYLPCIEYFLQIILHKKIHINLGEHYEKQTYRNRCNLLLTNQVYSLTVPVKHALRKQQMLEVEIDQSRNWARHHWKTICSAYGKSPFFEYYSFLFEEIYQKNSNLLWELNLGLLSICLKTLNIQKEIIIEKKYLENEEIKGQTDLRKLIHPKKEKKGERLSDSLIYRQAFGKTFVPNLSVVDLLFAIGPQSGDLMKNLLKGQQEK